MRGVFLSTLAFSLTMSVAALLTPPKPIPAEPWLADNFDRLDFKNCKECWKQETAPSAEVKSDQTEEEFGIILIPNLSLPFEMKPWTPQ